MPATMDAASHLTSLGWRGPGHSLDSHIESRNGGRGLAKPLLITHRDKSDARGLGSRTQAERQADQWWLSAFDGALREMASANTAAVAGADAGGKAAAGTGTGLKMLENVRTLGVGKGGLYGWFVKGETLGGTIDEDEVAAVVTSRNGNVTQEVLKSVVDAINGQEKKSQRKKDKKRKRDAAEVEVVEDKKGKKKDKKRKRDDDSDRSEKKSSKSNKDDELLVKESKNKSKSKAQSPEEVQLKEDIGAADIEMGEDVSIDTTNGKSKKSKGKHPKEAALEEEEEVQPRLESRTPHISKSEAEADSINHPLISNTTSSITSSEPASAETQASKQTSIPPSTLPHLHPTTTTAVRALLPAIIASLNSKNRRTYTAKAERKHQSLEDFMFYKHARIKVKPVLTKKQKDAARVLRKAAQNPNATMAMGVRIDSRVRKALERRVASPGAAAGADGFVIDTQGDASLAPGARAASATDPPEPLDLADTNFSATKRKLSKGQKRAEKVARDKAREAWESTLTAEELAKWETRKAGKVAMKALRQSKKRGKGKNNPERYLPKGNKERKRLAKEKAVK